MTASHAFELPPHSAAPAEAVDAAVNGFSKKDKGDGQRLWNLAPLIDPEQRFTRLHRGSPQLIDHIMVSHRVVQIVKSGDVRTGAAPLPSNRREPECASE